MAANAMSGLGTFNNKMFRITFERGGTIRTSSFANISPTSDLNCLRRPTNPHASLRIGPKISTFKVTSRYLAFCKYVLLYFDHLILLRVSSRLFTVTSSPRSATPSDTCKDTNKSCRRVYSRAVILQIWQLVINYQRQYCSFRRNRTSSPSALCNTPVISLTRGTV